MLSKIFLLSFLSFCFSSGIATLIKKPPIIEWGAFLFALLALLTLFLLQRDTIALTKFFKFLQLMFFIFLWISIGLFRVVIFNNSVINGYDRILQTSDSAKDSTKNKKTAFFIQTIVNQTSSKQTLLALACFEQMCGLNLRTLFEPDGLEVVLSTSAYPHFIYGDIVTGPITGKSGLLLTPVDNNSFGKWLNAQGVFYQIQNWPVLESSGNGPVIKKNLYYLKQIILNRINVLLSAPESNLLAGLLLGEKKSLGDEITKAFQTAGLSHMVVLSGYNITIVALAVAWMSTFLPRISVAASLLSIIAFAILAGASATVVRAAAMSAATLIAQAFGRKYNPLRILLLTAWALLLCNPYTLLFDPSFQLSFLATLALILVVPILEPWFVFIKVSFLRTLVVSTMATQIMVLPSILYLMGGLSTVALFANIAVVPTVSVAMFLGALVLFISIWSQPLALLASLPLYVILHYQIGATKLFASIPYARLPLSFGVEELILSYCIYLILFALIKLFSTTSQLRLAKKSSK